MGLHHRGAMKRRAVLLAIAGLAVAAPTASAYDISVANIEVTQAIQTPDNAIPLIARRSTAVRVTVGVAGSGGTSVPVSGRLHVFEGGVELTPPDGQAPDQLNFFAKPAPDRAQDGDTLNFTLPAPTRLHAGTTLAQPNASATFRVDLGAPDDANSANNSATTRPLTILPAPKLTIYHTRVDYQPSGLGFPDATLGQSNAGELFVKAIMPVDDSDPDLYEELPGNEISFEGGANGGARISPASGTSSDDPDAADLLDVISQRRELLVTNGVAVGPQTLVYGWLAGNPCDCNGMTSGLGGYGFSNSDITRGQRTLAHEVGHALLGGAHNSRTLDQVGWDVLGRLVGTWQGNGVRSRAKPTTLNDIMVPAKLSSEAWIDTQQYKALISRLITTPRARTIATLVRQTVIRGTILVRRIGPPTPLSIGYAYTYPWRVPATRSLSGLASTRLQLTLKTFRGTTLKKTFQQQSVGDQTSEPRVQPFSVPVTVPAGVKSIGVRPLGASRDVIVRTFSRATPVVRIVSPQRGATLSGRMRMRWAASDADTPARSLRYQVAFSNDDGRSFVPVDVDIRGTSLLFDAGSLPSTRGKGVLRIFASDGINSSYTDIGRLSVAAKP